MESHKDIPSEIKEAITRIYENCMEANKSGQIDFSNMSTMEKNQFLNPTEAKAETLDKSNLGTSKPTHARLNSLKRHKDQKEQKKSASTEEKDTTFKIVAVDKKFKFDPIVSIFLNPVEHYFYNLNSYNQHIKSIKVTQVSLLTSTNLITLELADGQHFYLYAKSNYISDAIKVLIDKLPPEHVEIKFKKQFKQDRKPYEQGFWSVQSEEKKAENWDNSIDIKVYYEDISDPLIVKKLEEQLIQFKKTAGSQNKKLNIIDAGGGKGRLAEKLIKKLIEYEIPFTYTLVELDKSQCEFAEKVLSQFSKNKDDIKVINMDLHTFAETYEKDYAGNVDIIVSSGGPLNLDIVSAHVAEQNLKDVAMLLSENGKIIATGLTKLFFNQKHFQQLGLEVKSTTERSTVDNKLYQCYLVEKPAKKDLELNEDKGFNLKL